MGRYLARPARAAGRYDSASRDFAQGLRGLGDQDIDRIGASPECRMHACAADDQPHTGPTTTSLANDSVTKGTASELI